MAPRDYYTVLGVPRDADPQTIRKAYRRLARKLHPDVNPDDPEAEARFKEATAAYEVLGDPTQRARYDRFGHAGVRGAGRRARPAGDVPDLDDILGAGLGELFESLFGGAAGPGGRPGGARRPRGRGPTGRGPRASGARAVEQPITLELHEALHGATRHLRVAGRKLEARIPAGVRDGSRVRMRGAAGGRDLVLVVRLRTDEGVRVDGDDVRVAVEVDLFDALLGGEATVPAPDGPLRLSIPPGTANGRTFRLRGRGLPLQSERSRRGDLLARVQVRLPEELDEHERRTLEALRERRHAGERQPSGDPTDPAAA